MIERKRELFKSELRRQQLNSIFKERRMQLLEPLNFESYMYSIHSSPLGKCITQGLIDIEVNLKHGNYEKFEGIVASLANYIKEEAFQASAYLIIQSSQFNKILRSIIENEDLEQEDKSSISQGQGGKSEKLDTPLQHQIISSLFNLLALMSYRQLRQDYFSKLLSAFWLVFSNIDIYDNHHIFDQTLLIIKKMLNSRVSIVFSCLKAIGLGSQLVRMITFSQNFLSHQNQLHLIEIIENYVIMEKKLKQHKYDNTNGASQLGMDASLKGYFIGFSILLIFNNHQQGCYFALSSLVQIFEIYKSLIINIDINTAKAICELINSQSGKVQEKALELLDDMIFAQDKKGEELLQGYFLPDLLYIFLCRQLKQPSASTKHLCLIAANIIRNLTFAKNQMKEKYTSHPIWELAYENINMASPLLPLVVIFELYFVILPRETAVKLFQNYAHCVSNLEMNYLQKRCLETIKKTVQRVCFQSKDFWPQSLADRVMRAIYGNKLANLVEDIIDVEEELNFV